MPPTNETIKFKYYLSESCLDQPINTRNRGVYKLKGLAQTISTLADNVADKYDLLPGILTQCHIVLTVVGEVATGTSYQSIHEFNVYTLHKAYFSKINFIEEGIKRAHQNILNEYLDYHKTRR